MSPIAIVTGASRGLGATLAAFLVAEDYDLVIDARGEEALAGMAQRLARPGRRVTAIAGDIADEDHRRRLVEAAGALGGLDLLVNNASILGPSPLPALADLALADLAGLLAVNAAAPLGLVQEALPLLQRRGGLVVNISSDAAVGGYKGWGGYGAAKAALDLMSLTLAGELADRNIAVVAVDPGDMRTAMHQAAFPGEDISDRPMPEATLPFFAWLLGQGPRAISGRRYRAQADRWEVAA